MKLYPHDTRLKRDVIIQQKRYLPRQLKGTVNISKGQEVTASSVVARADMDQGYYVFDGREALNIKAEEVEQYVAIDIGVQIRRTAPLLIRPKRFGRSQEIESPVEGILEDILDGRLLIRRTPRELLVRSMLNGWVVGVESKRGVTVEIQGAQIEVVWGNGKEGYGELKVLTEDPAGTSDEDEIGREAQGSMLAMGHLADVGLIEHAIKRGARGLILGTTTPAIFAELKSFDIPIYLTEGVNMQGMSTPVFDLLNENEYKTVSMLGIASSKTRRPEILLSDMQRGRGLPAPAFAEVKVGQRVRLLRPPYDGKTGEIQAIYPHARESAMGYVTAGADVLLSSGLTVFVPDSNLDIIM